MAGIVGLITNGSPEWAQDELRKMVGSLPGSGTQECGTWIDQAAGVYVGWIARKGDGEMPHRNERGDVTLVFSGEDFPDAGIVNRLRQQGHDVGRGSAYLVHQYEEDSSGFLPKLNGRFHGLIIDQNTGTATLFIDRYGMHRIYYYESRDAFYFSAEAKAILRVRPELRSTDPRGLGEFVACGCTLENRTIFNQLMLLPAAASWTFRAGTVERKSQYFKPEEWENLTQLDCETYYKDLKSVFSSTLERYFAAGEKIGLSLTGGLDTRMILAWHKPAPGDLPCYSFGGMVRESRDVRIARKIAAACGQPHQVISVGKSFLDHFPDYAERTVYLTDGTVEVKHAPDLYVNELAREIAPIRMTGNYGDEVLRRARVLKAGQLDQGLSVFNSDFQPCLQMASETCAKVAHCAPLSFSVFRQAPWHHHGLLSLEESQLSVRTPYLDNDLVRTVFRAPDSALANNDIRLRLIRDGDCRLERIRTDLGFGGVSHGLSGYLSQKLHSTTMRAEYAYDYGMPQKVAHLDHLLQWWHLERLFLGRHKFYHFRVWYRDALARYVKETLLDERTLSRPYLNRQGVVAMVQRHTRGDRNYTTHIHKLLTLELVHRLFID